MNKGFFAATFAVSEGGMGFIQTTSKMAFNLSTRRVLRLFPKDERRLESP
jgi:hypothetical protein